jgi:hypothetical protein
MLSNLTTSAGITFMFNNTPATSFDAQASCNTLGANLAWFASLAEQAEVEAGFIAAGKMLPAFHRAYWLGLRSPRPSNNPSDYKWLDKTAGPVAYQAWGYYQGGPAGGSGPEPDNRGGAEACGAGNFSEARNNASGWADASCGLRLPFMCRSLSEWHVLGSSRLWWHVLGSSRLWWDLDIDLLLMHLPPGPALLSQCDECCCCC